MDIIKLKYFVKYNKVLYKVYSAIGSCLIRMLSIFYKVDENKVLFVVYGGQRYDDSPKNVYEYMVKNENFKKYKMYWAFISPETISEDIPNKIRIDSFEYYKTALQCKYWITNSSAQRGLNFMPKDTINVFFTHGMTGIKKIGTSINYRKNKKVKKERKDYIVIEGKKEYELIKDAWNLTTEKILNIGLPRNDDLVNRSEKDIIQVKEKLGIPNNRKVILYAPTFREYSKDSKNVVFLKPPFDFDLWHKELGENYILLLTAHYEVAKLMDIPDNHPFLINAFQYPHINDLMVVSDLLISDYSSIIFDYSILERPILSYSYDYDEYKKVRGIYDGYDTLFFDGILKSEKEVIKVIKQLDFEKESKYVAENIKDRYISNYGDATEKAVQTIFGDSL